MQLDFSLCLPFTRLADCLDILSLFCSTIFLSCGRLHSITAWIPSATNKYFQLVHNKYKIVKSMCIANIYYWQPENKTFVLHNVHFNCSKLLPVTRTWTWTQIFIHNVFHLDASTELTHTLSCHFVLWWLNSK